MAEKVHCNIAAKDVRSLNISNPKRAARRPTSKKICQGKHSDLFALGDLNLLLMFPRPEPTPPPPLPPQMFGCARLDRQTKTNTTTADMDALNRIILAKYKRLSRTDVAGDSVRNIKTLIFSVDSDFFSLIPAIFHTAPLCLCALLSPPASQLLGR